jgi:Tol biopolymer transport system component
VDYDSAQRNVQSKVVSAVWAPDSQSLAMVVYDTPLTTMREDLPVFMINADGSEKREIATTTVPAALQFLPDGTLAYQNGAELHLVDPATGEDQVAATGLDTQPENGLPYRLSPDGAAVALMHGTTLSVLDFASASVTELTTTVDHRRWGSYAWWSRDVLIYSDLDYGNLPRIFSFDLKAGTVAQLLSTTRRGAYADLAPTSSGGWLLYVYRDKGNMVETGALYEAVNVYSGQQSALFEWGLGLDFDERTSEIRFQRTIASPEDIGGYVATVSY